MITNVNKKVVCIKDIPSNVIEEAIFILKPKDEKDLSDGIKNKRKDIALKEAQNLLSEYVGNEKEKFKKVKLKHSNYEFGRVKQTAILISIAIALCAYMIFKLF